jgi:hypothetical protein
LVLARSQPDRTAGQHCRIDQQWGSIMYALLSLIYRAYCKARLAEMRKYHAVA